MYQEVFPSRIKKARIDYGLSQSEVAKITGIPRSSISKYENGAIQPDIEKLGMLAELYEVSVDWLLGINKRSTPGS